jgi:hypothetical protein
MDPATIQRFADLQAQMCSFSSEIKAQADRAQLSYDRRMKAFAELKVVFNKEESPPGEFKMAPLKCIPFNPNYQFFVKRGIENKAEYWWSRLKFDYEFDDSVVESDIFPVFGCYLDLHPRNSALMPTYGEDMVNVYIPTSIAGHLIGMIERHTQHAIDERREIVDNEQGLTSFLASLHPKGKEWTVSVYEEKLELNDTTKEDEVGGIIRHKVPLTKCYKDAEKSSSARVLEGVAFIHMNANFSCEPSEYPSKSPLPKECRVYVKIKLVGFHCLGRAGDSVAQITYKEREVFDYQRIASTTFQSYGTTANDTILIDCAVDSCKVTSSVHIIGKVYTVYVIHPTCMYTFLSYL